MDLISDIDIYIYMYMYINSYILIYTYRQMIDYQINEQLVTFPWHKLMVIS